jgi:general secretion pathway protein J
MKKFKSLLVLFFRKERLPCFPESNEDGFTLFEILIAVVVLGFVIAGLSQATRFGINAWDTQARIAERTDEMERADRVLRLVITEAAAPLAADDKPFAGQEHRMVFVTHLPSQPPTDPVSRAQVALGVDGEHRLVLRWEAHANAIAIKPPPVAPPIVLAEGVDHIDVLYCQSVDDGGKWLHVWDDSSLPALVQIHIVMQDKRRVWPAVQVATMLDNNGSF